MEQMYLIEIFIDKVTIYESDEDKPGNPSKNLIIKVKFGPKTQFIVKESQLAVNERPDDIITTDEITGRREWSRTIRVGKSYLFPSFPDTILMMLSKFPLEIEVWNDDETEAANQIFVGVGNMHWHTHFFHMLKETADPCKIHEPLSIKNRTVIYAECCCSQAGTVDFILRLSALGNTIITEFQQLLKDPESFVFRTNKAPSMFQCHRVDGDDPNFCMVGSLYETTTLEDPDLMDQANKKIEVCTELQSCGMGGKAGEMVCDHPDEGSAQKKYAIDKIRMGDIIGPCGNANCELAHKVRRYIRNLDTYKTKAASITDKKSVNERKVCGKCICKDDRYHRDECPRDILINTTCTGCQGLTAPGNTCKDKIDKQFDTGATPKTSDTHIAGTGSPPKKKEKPDCGTGTTPKTKDPQVGYAFSITAFPDYKKGMFGHDTIVENCFCSKIKSAVDVNSTGCTATSQDVAQSITRFSYRNATSSKSDTKTNLCKSSIGVGISTPIIYNVSQIGTSYQIPMSNVGTNPPANVEQKRKVQVYNFTEMPVEKDCKCTPKKPAPPCKTFDCDCLAETQYIASRKIHKPYCPSYKHKDNCPVTMMHEEDELKKSEEDEEESTPLPYGLPPIKLGPCPILGRPCTVPDGFARMYKNAQVPTQPFSYSNDGKVCCSKEYERIKKAIREYTRNDKESDFRCINQFNIDTERRCCDKEQVLAALTGKACCGSHKLAIQEKFKKEDKKQP